MEGGGSFSEDQHTEIHTEALAFFTSQLVNTAEKKISWTVYKPSLINKANSQTVVGFHIEGNSTQYIDLRRSELKIEVKIVDDDGNPISNNKIATPIDMIMHTMWSNIDIKLNKTQVSSSNTNYMYKSFFENLLNYSKTAKEIQLQCVGFSGESGDMTVTNPDPTVFTDGKIDTKKGLTINEGLTGRYRRWWSKRNNKVVFSGPLCADICNQSKLILNRIDIDINMVQTRDEFRLLTFPSETKAKLIIEEISLYVCKV